MLETRSQIGMLLQRNCDDSNTSAPKVYLIYAPLLTVNSGIEFWPEKCFLEDFHVTVKSTFGSLFETLSIVDL